MMAKMRHIITKFQNIEDEEKSFISFQKEGETVTCEESDFTAPPEAER